MNIIVNTFNTGISPFMEKDYKENISMRNMFLTNKISETIQSPYPAILFLQEVSMKYCEYIKKLNLNNIIIKRTYGIKKTYSQNDEKNNDVREIIAGNFLIVVYSHTMEYKETNDIFSSSEIMEYGTRDTGILHFIYKDENIYCINIHGKVPKLAPDDTFAPYNIYTKKVIARFLQKKQELLLDNPDAVVILGGDFNTTPENLNQLGLDDVEYLDVNAYTNISSRKEITTYRLDYIYVFSNKKMLIHEYIHDIKKLYTIGFDHSVVCLVITIQ